MRHGLTFSQAKALTNRTSSHISDNYLNGNDINCFYKLFSVIQFLNKVMGDSHLADRWEQMRADQVIQNSLAADDISFLSIESRCIIFKILPYRSNFVTRIQNFGCAFLLGIVSLLGH